MALQSMLISIGLWIIFALIVFKISDYRLKNKNKKN